MMLEFVKQLFSWLVSGRKGRGYEARADFAVVTTRWARLAEQTAKRLEDALERLEVIEKELQITRARLEGCYAECEKDRQIIAELKARLTELERNTEQLSAVVTVDETGQIIEWNSTATKLFQFTREEAVGKNVTLITPPKLRSKHFRAFSKAVQNRREPRAEPLDTVAMNAQGVEIPVRISLSGWEVSGKLLYSAEIKRIHVAPSN